MHNAQIDQRGQGGRIYLRKWIQVQSNFIRIIAESDGSIGRHWQPTCAQFLSPICSFRVSIWPGYFFQGQDGLWNLTCVACFHWNMTVKFEIDWLSIRRPSKIAWSDPKRQGPFPRGSLQVTLQAGHLDSDHGTWICMNLQVSYFFLSSDPRWRPSAAQTNQIR